MEIQPATRPHPHPRLAAIALAAWVVLWGNAFDAKAASERPTGIVLISVDSLRADHVGAYGGPVATPAIDALAREGVLVEEAFSSIPAGGPAHASLLTGRYPWRHGTLRNGVPLDARLPLLAQGLRKAGFATAAFVSSQHLSRGFGFHRGFDVHHFEPTEDFVWRRRRQPAFFARADATVSAAMSWVTGIGDAPFFLWVQLSEPHLPYRPPSEYRQPRSASAEVRTNERLPDGVASRDQLDALKRAYRGEVAAVDAAIGRLVQRLQLLGVDGRSAVIVTAGHGEALGEHGELGHRANLFDEEIRVPLVLRAPGLPAGRRLAGPVQLEDLAPTIRAWAGAAPLPASDGFDLGPWLAGEAAESPRAAAFGQRRASQSGATLYYEVRGRTKWIGRADAAGVSYERALDPGESKPTKGEGLPEALGRALADAPPTAD
jgi:choline-sulfatase